MVSVEQCKPLRATPPQAVRDLDVEPRKRCGVGSETKVENGNKASKEDEVSRVLWRGTTG